MTAGRDVRVLADGLDHPEGVAWGPDGRLYAGGEAGQLYRVDIATGHVEQYAATGGFVLGIALDAAGNVYCCDATRRAVLHVSPGGDTEVISTGCPERPVIAPNYPAFAPDGALFVSDSGRWPEGGGCILRVDPDGSTTVWSDAAGRVTNGLAVSPGGTHLYVVESTAPAISRIAIGLGGHAGALEPVLAMPGMVPDGLAFDRDGDLYVACYRPDAIIRMTARGTVECFASDWQGTKLAAPTNITFAGPDRDILVSANLGRWHLSAMEAGTPGLRLLHPAPIRAVSARGLDQREDRT